MTNPTSNFGWQMPTSTDLVTDLPADFETFGQAVDTDLADLKGGTTGQVLAKASATDMDFAWVAQDDSNAIQNAIVDAKGDLIGASAADTPARLAVGSNGQVLVADSTAATGLKWAGAYTTYTPTFTNLTIGNGVIQAEYVQVGKLVHVYILVSFGSTTVMGSEPFFTLPVTARNNNQRSLGTFYIEDAGVANYTGIFFFRNNTSVTPFIPAVNGTYFGGPAALNATTPFTWATGDFFQGTFIYGAA